MPDLKHVQPVHDKATLDLLQRAYNDFCRDAGIHAKPSNPNRTSPTRDAVAK